MRPLQPRERRILAVGLLVAAVGLVWLAIISPLVGGFFARAAERRDLIATYQRDQRLIGQTGVWRGLARQQARTAPRFAIAAPSQQLAMEALKERLVKLAADEGFTVTGLSDLAADAPAGKVRLRADLQLTLTQLYESLRRLQAEGSYVVVEYFAVSADRALAIGRSAPMAVRLEITAAYRPVRPRSS